MPTEFVRITLPNGVVSTVTKQYAQMLGIKPLGTKQAITRQGNPLPAKPKTRPKKGRTVPTAPAGEPINPDQE